MSQSDLDPRQYCEFVKERGYWKGYRCCNLAKSEHGGKHYCPVHYGIVMERSRPTEAGSDD